MNWSYLCPCRNETVFIASFADVDSVVHAQSFVACSARDVGTSLFGVVYDMAVAIGTGSWEIAVPCHFVGKSTERYL